MKRRSTQRDSVSFHEGPETHEHSPRFHTIPPTVRHMWVGWRACSVPIPYVSTLPRVINFFLHIKTDASALSRIAALTERHGSLCGCPPTRNHRRRMVSTEQCADKGMPHRGCVQETVHPWHGSPSPKALLVLLVFTGHHTHTYSVR
jgi:hypothetical protein